ncbi:MAG: hypothetical protein FWD64_08815 [Acidobacteriaceae bacterium]|nr:hypothetical protein [Acidobacteriaceae bacterium]
MQKILGIGIHAGFTGFARLIILLYFVATIAIGWLARRKGLSANSYLNASRSLPLWIVVPAYVAANCGRRALLSQRISAPRATAWAVRTMGE